jgi:hypothetical protein
MRDKGLSDLGIGEQLLERLDGALWLVQAHFVHLLATSNARFRTYVRFGARA